MGMARRAAWGPGGWAATSGNVYHQWGSTGAVGNAYTGMSETISAGKVTGPGGQSPSVAHAGDETYADHDGNVYRYDSQSGSFQQHDAGGGWSDASADRSQSLG